MTLPESSVGGAVTTTTAAYVPGRSIEHAIAVVAGEGVTAAEALSQLEAAGYEVEADAVVDVRVLMAAPPSDTLSRRTYCAYGTAVSLVRR